MIRNSIGKPTKFICLKERFHSTFISFKQTKAHGFISLFVFFFFFSLSCTKQQNTSSPDFDPLLEGYPSQTKSPPKTKRFKNLVISRQALVNTINTGFGAFLGNIEIDPYFHHKQFAGWTILYTPYRSFDLQAGDIVKSVNGSSVERPKQAFELWQSLAETETIAFVIERQGQPVELTLSVSDEENTKL